MQFKVSEAGNFQVCGFPGCTSQWNANVTSLRDVGADIGIAKTETCFSYNHSFRDLAWPSRTCIESVVVSRHFSRVEGNPFSK